MTATPPKPRRRRWRWLVPRAVLLCFIAGWLLKSEPPPQIVFRLSNGELIGYRAAGLGKLDHCEQSPAYRRCYDKLAQYAPVFVSKELPAPRVTKLGNVKTKTGAESLILFFERLPDAHYSG